MTFEWQDLVTVRAALSHRGIPFRETAHDQIASVYVDGTAIAALLDLAHHHAEDAQSGEWADNAIAAVIASGLERDVVEAGGLVAESVQRLDAVAAAALAGPVVFSLRLQR